MSCHIPAPRYDGIAAMNARLSIEIISIAGAVLTTLCWLPQVIKAVRDKETGALSLSATAGFTGGVWLWLIYGLAIHDWPLR